MKSRLLLIALVAQSTSFGQVLDYDGNDDGCVNVDDMLGLLIEYGQCSEEQEEFICGDNINHEGYNYSTVQIGDQCWFSENCRYLPLVSPSSEGSETSPYYYVYGYEGTDVAAAQTTDNYETYGVLQNWPAVMTGGICPSGWHIPSDGEFTQLTDFLGGESVAGYAMKSTSGWNDFIGSSGNGSNSSGWTGLPDGVRASGGFGGIRIYSYWWSSSESGSDSWLRALGYSYISVIQMTINQQYGSSARCVQDQNLNDVQSLSNLSPT